MLLEPARIRREPHANAARTPRGTGAELKAACTRGAAKQVEQLFALATGAAKVMVPLAPSAGLLLDRVLYGAFKKRFPHIASLEFEDLDDKMREFKERMVHPAVVDRETRDMCTLVWLNELEIYHYQWLQQLGFKEAKGSS